MAKKKKIFRLAKDFHKTFKPERHYINALLKYAASGQSGDYQEIADATGIPTGKSSGKVTATIDYCRGMGLITVSSKTKSSKKEPQLTDFGRTVFLNDQFLKTPLTQWIAHLHLCSPLYGAEVWYQTFFAGTPVLGMSFSKDKLESHLRIALNISKGKVLGPLIGTYQDEASFKICGALTQSQTGVLRRREAPFSPELILGYGAWVLHLINLHFPGRDQVSVVELDDVSGWCTIPGWSATSWQKALSQFEYKGLIDVDRHMDPWIISPRASTQNAWRSLFNDMI